MLSLWYVTVFMCCSTISESVLLFLRARERLYGRGVHEGKAHRQLVSRGEP